MKKIKTMCGIKPKDLGAVEEEFRKQACKPRYFCKKCLRVARKKNCLCKPEEL